jgi:hypothetical protein
MAIRFPARNCSDTAVICDGGGGLLLLCQTGEETAPHSRADLLNGVIDGTTRDQCQAETGAGRG